jgi:hypothetical protein
MVTLGIKPATPGHLFMPRGHCMSCDQGASFCALINYGSLFLDKQLLGTTAAHLASTNWSLLLGSCRKQLRMRSARLLFIIDLCN